DDRWVGSIQVLWIAGIGASSASRRSRGSPRLGAASESAAVPDRRLEKTLGALVCGVDEAGRGPLAGPVVAAAVILPARLPRGLSSGIDDSKKLTRERREALYGGIRDCCSVGVG